ncbi:MAG: Molybdopterin molybdenumtransferase [Candidatus Dichloromethanomonas elyunquensis]|nr:MAG: Molybdopterin molybdenumtransferase [Candidatus Dichloromethanomonas elyunquensis]
MKTNISLEEARTILLENDTPMIREYINLQDSLDRVVSENIIAEENLPPFARSPYDGYAFRAEDTATATKEKPVILEVIEEVPAGAFPRKRIISGKTAKILTGAPIPEGANAVAKYEETEISGNLVSIFSGFKPGENVVPAGEDLAQGEIIARKGMVVSPPVLGLMAALGISRIPVYKRPKIAIICTGDELLDVSEPLRPGMIRNSNTYTLAAYCREIGAEPIVLGTVRDRVEEVGEMINRGLSEADMVITTGGVSVGDYDVLGEAVANIGAETLYWKVEIKPGSPNLTAIKNSKVILGLSGNPAAALVIFHLLGVPFIKKLAGYADYLHPQIKVMLKNNFQKASPRRRFLRGKLVIENGAAWMEITGGQGNGVLRSLIDCDILAEIPPGSGPQMAGSKLQAYFLK